MKTDVLVIGGGLAGKRCAETAAEYGGVTLIADGAGASPMIHGVNVPLHPDDSVELFVSDTGKSGRGQGKPELVRALCRGSLSLAEEFPFTKKADGSYDLLKPLGSSVPRVAGIDGRTGAKILRDIDEKKRFRELRNTRALRLRVEDGRVSGAYCFDTAERKWFYIGAKAVVLATGGFGGLFPFSTNSSDIGGDGVAMAYEAGASLCDMEFIQFEPTAAVFPDAVRGKSVITTMLFEGAVMRGGDGRRFMEEKVNKDELSLGIYREILKGNVTEHGGVYYDMTGVPEDLLKGKYKDYYHRYLAVGTDISRQPVEIAPAPHTTLGGVSVDETCATEIKGLFACGEVTGGLHGANRLGGNAGLEVLVFGKIAGKSAGEYAKGCPEPREYPAPEPDGNAPREEEIREMRERLTAATAKALGVIREETGLSELGTLAEQTAAYAAAHPFDFGCARLYNDAVTVLLSAVSARERKGTLGCHVRSDSVPEREKYRLTVRKIGDHAVPEKEIIDGEY